MNQSRGDGHFCGNAQRSFSRSTIFNSILLALLFFIIVISQFSVNRIAGLPDDDDSASFPRSSLICTEGIMNRRTFSNVDATGLLALSSNQKCHLHFYNKDDVTRCMDELREQSNHSNLLHFVFIGDSRIRQHFYNFIELISGYSYEGQHLNKHAHVSTYSSLLNTSVAFYWNPQVDDAILNLTKDWASGVTNNPNFVLIGFASHYMMTMNGNNNTKFKNDVIALAPVLKRLGRRGTRIVWWKQDPPFEPQDNKDFSTQKMDHYNELAQRIFKENDVPIEVWDSTNVLSEEYVRSCSLFPTRRGIFLKAWMFCNDFLHPGNSATIQGIQLLYNELCNRYI